MTTPTDAFALQCPIPISDYPNVVMAHGGGGRLMRSLIERMFGAAFANPFLDERHDGAALPTPAGARLAFTTDSYVIRPLFFPGGDIGHLAICGAVNDLAMCGARPLYLSVGFILEEGLPMETLWRVVRSMRDTARSCGVQIVTGDTKVVDRGKGDGIYINVAGIGSLDDAVAVGPGRVLPGDAVIISGDLGRHGISVMAVREGLEFDTTIESDCAPVHAPVGALTAAGIDVHCLRDLTRGGLASALVEIADSAGVGICIREVDIPVREDVAGACEMLGFDPLYVANEGRFVCFVAQADAARTLKILGEHPVSEGASHVGAVEGAGTRGVSIVTRIGARRVVDMLSGEQLPRIC